MKKRLAKKVWSKFGTRGVRYRWRTIVAACRSFPAVPQGESPAYAFTMIDPASEWYATQGARLDLKALPTWT